MSTYLAKLNEERKARKLRLGTFAIPKVITKRHSVFDPDVIKIRHIAKIVCKYNGYSLRTIRQNTRSKSIVFTRQMICFVGNHLYSISQKKIGRCLGICAGSVCKAKEEIKLRLSHDVHCAGDLKAIRGLL